MGLFSRKSVEDRLLVVNSRGIHIRPAISIYLLAKEYPGTNLHFSFRNRLAIASDINELVALEVSYQDEVKINIDGPKAKKIHRKLKRLFSDFDRYRVGDCEYIRGRSKSSQPRISPFQSIPSLM